MTVASFAEHQLEDHVPEGGRGHGASEPAHAQLVLNGAQAPNQLSCLIGWQLTHETELDHIVATPK